VEELRGDVAYDGNVVAAFDQVGSGRVRQYCCCRAGDARVSQPVAYANRSPTYLVHHPLGLVRLPVSIQSQPISLDEASGDVYGRR